ncbi:hypothetical protein PYW08_007765 [Mythimna loreyi]|uniref:Uncharacterized protein n=1 Tax=Mythimna loreyi TaxID=667449 RepID=A0ACC2QEN2_9NEOP|nr:hypothetical protein PYW08_007765 [Mythimna loreyi]
MLPDFSGCIADSLRDIYEQFTLISLGYSWQPVSLVARQYGAVLRSLSTHPGEGEPPLKHAARMLYYLMSAAAQPVDRFHSAEHLLYIFDHLLSHPDAFLDEEKIFELQNAVVDTAGLRSSFDKRFQEFTVTTASVQMDKAAHFSLNPAPVARGEWLVTSVTVQLVDKTSNASVVTVLYHDLEARLPSLRRYVEYKSGRATEYTIASQQVQVSVSGAGIDTTLPHTVTLLFAHSKNYSAIASQLACGGRSRFSPRVWSTLGCELRLPQRTQVACHCRGVATFALFIVDRESFTGTENDLRGTVKVIVRLGAVTCLVVALLQLLGLLAGSKIRLPVLLKAATAGFHSAALLALLECDMNQSVACEGSTGWVVAMCWMAGSAALCAAPLLLHADLAATATRVPSVGLLCGVCTLCWLTARLWGGAPLQLGASANAVCAAGQALLTLLALALTLALRARAREYEHKPRHELARERARVVRHTLVLLLTTCATQAAGVAYVQPTESNATQGVLLAAAACVQGVAMLVCYVLMDAECLQSTRRLLSLSSHSEWQGTTGRDVSHSLYIKQGREVECSSSSHVSPANTFWQASTLEDPNTMYRRQSSDGCMADIVRGVQHEHKPTSQRMYTRALCDLIPTDDECLQARIQPQVSRVCVELRVLPTHETDKRERPYRDGTDTPKDNCTLCSASTPDVSARPQKSCLKQRASQLSYSSLPSIHRRRSTGAIQTDNTHAQDTTPTHSTYTQTDKVLHKISHDLDFLLNRTPSRATDHCSQRIEEAPT